MCLDSILSGGHADVEVLIGVDGQASEEIGDDAAKDVIRWAMCNHFDKMDYLNPDYGNALRFSHASGVVIYLYRFPFSGKWGNTQRNKLLAAAHGDLICFMDQDDCFFPRALEGVARITQENADKPVIFKMEHPKKDEPSQIFWVERGLVAEGHIGGHMLVVPNKPELLGRWEPEERYAADFNFIDQTLVNFKQAGHEAVWSEEFIAKLRPWEAEL
jgi:hypothetical protein